MLACDMRCTTGGDGNLPTVVGLHAWPRLLIILSTRHVCTPAHARRPGELVFGA